MNIMDTNTFLKLTKHRSDLLIPYTSLDIRPRAVCADGFKISIQASRVHHCTPRSDEAEEYEAVELGFPSEKEDLILSYMEDLDGEEFTKTIYPYVPIEIVDKMLEKHGGIVVNIYNRI